MVLLHASRSSRILRFVRGNDLLRSNVCGIYFCLEKNQCVSFGGPEAVAECWVGVFFVGVMVCSERKRDTKEMMDGALYILYVYGCILKDI